VICNRYLSPVYNRPCTGCLVHLQDVKQKGTIWLKEKPLSTADMMILSMPMLIMVAWYIGLSTPTLIYIR